MFACALIKYTCTRREKGMGEGGIRERERKKKKKERSKKET